MVLYQRISMEQEIPIVLNFSMEYVQESYLKLRDEPSALQISDILFVQYIAEYSLQLP